MRRREFITLLGGAVQRVPRSNPERMVREPKCDTSPKAFPRCT